MSAPPSSPETTEVVAAEQTVGIAARLIADFEEIVASSTVAGEREPLSFGGQLLAEFNALADLPWLRLSIGVAFALALAWMLAWGGPALVRVGWRLGLDPRRRLGLLASGLRIAGLLVGFAGLLRPLLEQTPTLAVVTVITALALAGLAAPTQLRNLASGLSLATRSRLREGDLVTIGPLEGTVRDIGLLRVSLRTIDGGLTHVPAADFEGEAVTVGSRRAAVPIEAKVIAGPSFDDRALERLRRALWLSPYRRASTDPQVSVDVETGRVEVRMDTWAATSTVEVERHLRALLLAVTDGVTTEHHGPKPGEEVGA